MRSLKLTVASLVTVSTVFSVGRLRVASGFIAARTTSKLASGHAALGATGERRLAAVVAGRGVPDDRIVGLGSATTGDLETVTDLDALDRLDAHHRLGEHAVDLAVPVDVAAEADRNAVGEHLDDAAERIAFFGRGLDLADHRLFGRLVEASHGRFVDDGEIVRSRAGNRTSTGPDPSG